MPNGTTHPRIEEVDRREYTFITIGPIVVDHQKFVMLLMLPKDGNWTLFDATLEMETYSVGNEDKPEVELRPVANWAFDMRMAQAVMEWVAIGGPNIDWNLYYKELQDAIKAGFAYYLILKNTPEEE